MIVTMGLFKSRMGQKMLCRLVDTFRRLERLEHERGLSLLLEGMSERTSIAVALFRVESLVPQYVGKAHPMIVKRLSR